MFGIVMLTEARIAEVEQPVVFAHMPAADYIRAALFLHAVVEGVELSLWEGFAEDGGKLECL